MENGQIMGSQWPGKAMTMIGLRRLNTMEWLLMDIIDRGIPGHLIETGVWRGGTCAFMAAMLRLFGQKESFPR